MINWDSTQVSQFIDELPNVSKKYGPNFVKKKVDGKILTHLSEKDLAREIGISDFLDRKRIFIAISEFHSESITNEKPKKKLSKWKNGDKDGFSKLFAAMSWAFLVMFATAVVMTEVEARVPDRTAYPPLPDIILKNFGPIPEAFHITEYIILSLIALSLALLVVHKHRLVLLKRFFVIMGSVFALRCLTMSVTSLSVPAIHLECDIPKDMAMTIQQKLVRALQIFSGGALSINGVRTCGDYMFSGHSSMVTLLNYFITEYTPLNWRGLAVFTWTCNIIGCLCILLAHEHYTIDVLVAFVISSRLFVFYHSLCNSVGLQGAMHERQRTTWPLFSYWEEWTDDVVPSEAIFGIF